MKVVTVFNNKGGVGKTTFLCNLAAYLAISEQKKILVIDADPQCNATSYLLSEDDFMGIYENENRQTISNFLEPLKKGKGYFQGDFKIIRSNGFHINLIPGDPNLAMAEDLLASDWAAGGPRGWQTTFVFSELLKKYKTFDYVFIDVGPSLGAINRAVLLASDYFVMPMSSDIFSLMAIKNISQALTSWKKGLEKGLAESTNDLSDEHRWKLSFAGYVLQQYTAKTVQGNRQPVKAYEKVLREVPKAISRYLSKFEFDGSTADEFKLGDIPNLHSLIPMSQLANTPIFCLKGKDGVVGAHFAKVSDAEKIYKEISKNFLRQTNG